MVTIKEILQFKEYFNSVKNRIDCVHYNSKNKTVFSDIYNIENITIHPVLNCISYEESASNCIFFNINKFKVIKNDNGFIVKFKGGVLEFIFKQ